MTENFAKRTQQFINYANEKGILDSLSNIRFQDGRNFSILEPDTNNKHSYMCHLDFGTAAMMGSSTKHFFQNWNMASLAVDLNVNDEGDVKGVNPMDLQIYGELPYSGITFRVVRNGIGYQLWYKPSADNPLIVELDQIRGDLGGKLFENLENIRESISPPKNIEVGSFMIDMLNIDANVEDLRRSLWADPTHQTV